MNINLLGEDLFDKARYNLNIRKEMMKNNLYKLTLINFELLSEDRTNNVKKVETSI